MWTLWYEDGSRFTSDDGAPHESPVGGAVLVSQDVPGNEVLSYGQAWFVHRTDLGWLNCDREGMHDQVMYYAHLIDCVRFGRWMERDAWRDVQKRAAIDLRGK
jgi:hypothetical protein